MISQSVQYTVNTLRQTSLEGVSAACRQAQMSLAQSSLPARTRLARYVDSYCYYCTNPNIGWRQLSSNPNDTACNRAAVALNMQLASGGFDTSRPLEAQGGCPTRLKPDRRADLVNLQSAIKAVAYDIDSLSTSFSVLDGQGGYRLIFPSPQAQNWFTSAVQFREAILNKLQEMWQTTVQAYCPQMHDESDTTFDLVSPEFYAGYLQSWSRGAAENWGTISVRPALIYLVKLLGRPVVVKLIENLGKPKAMLEVQEALHAAFFEERPANRYMRGVSAGANASKLFFAVNEVFGSVLGERQQKVSADSPVQAVLNVVGKRLPLPRRGPPKGLPPFTYSTDDPSIHWHHARKPSDTTHALYSPCGRPVC